MSHIVWVLAVVIAAEAVGLATLWVMLIRARRMLTPRMTLPTGQSERP